MPIGNLLTAKDIAERLKVSMSRVRQFVLEKKITPKQKIGSVNLFDASTIADFAKKSRKVGRPRKSKD